MTPVPWWQESVIVITLQYFNLIYAQVAMHITKLKAAQKL
jgi:hypothetical protein